MNPAEETSVQETPMPVLPEEVAQPDIDALIIEDGKAVDGIFAEKQYRLLTEPLYSSWKGPEENRTFVVMANVGLFFSGLEPPLVPDIMLSLDVLTGTDLSLKQHNSYLIWVFGKPPDVVIELVSDRRGREDSFKFKTYARIGVPYYVIFDPKNKLGQGELRAFVLTGKTYQSLPDCWFSDVALGLTVCEAKHEGHPGRWLRWCDERGNLIPTGQERAAKEQHRADKEKREKELLAAKLRELGIDPSTLLGKN